MKNKLVVTIIIVLLVVTIIPNYIYAVDLKDLEVNQFTYNDLEEVYGEENLKKLIDEGKADINTENGKRTMTLQDTVSLGSSGTTALGSLILIPGIIVSSFLTLLTRDTSELLIKDDIVTSLDESKKADVGKIGGYSINFFTIEDTVFGKIELFDTDYLLPNKNSNKINQSVKESIALFYYTLRVLAIVLGLLTLIYLGIRMALSTIASDIAKYKSMLKDWLISMILIFAMPYIIGFINLIASSLTNLFAVLNTTKGFEKSILWQTFILLDKTSGWSYMATIAMYLVITFYQLKFFLMYFNRLLLMGFLIVISPIASVAYSLSKTKISGEGGKSQIFDTWIKEYSINALIQPIHAAIYLFFIASANEIFKVAPLLAVLFFAMLSKAESIVKNILGLTKTKSIDGLSEYLSVKKLK